MAQDLITRLVYTRNSAIFGKLAYYGLKLFGLEVPRSVPVGEGLEIVHSGVGIVIHSKTQIGNGVKIYPGVTLGRADIHRSASESRFEKIVIEDDVVLGAGLQGAVPGWYSGRQPRDGGRSQCGVIIVHRRE